MQQLSLTVGPVHTGDGGSGSQGLRSGRENELILSELQGRFYEKTSRGGKFMAPWNSVTIAATHVSPLTAGTGTPIVGIYNPTNSGMNISITKTIQDLISGTPGGPLVWNIVPLPWNITAASSSPQSKLINGPVGSVAKLWVNTAVTGSSAGINPFVEGGFAAVAAGAAVNSFVHQHDGDIVIPPGSMLALCAYAPGTSHLISGVVEWDEVFQN